MQYSTNPQLFSIMNPITELKTAFRELRNEELVVKSRFTSLPGASGAVLTLANLHHLAASYTYEAPITMDEIEPSNSLALMSRLLGRPEQFFMDEKYFPIIKEKVSQMGGIFPFFPILAIGNNRNILSIVDRGELNKGGDVVELCVLGLASCSATQEDWLMCIYETRYLLVPFVDRRILDSCEAWEIYIPSRLAAQRHKLRYIDSTLRAHSKAAPAEAPSRRRAPSKTNRYMFPLVTAATGTVIFLIYLFLLLLQRCCC